ncbi:hypothetical protein NC995_25520 [Leptolyngbya sp. FACHB-1515]
MQEFGINTIAEQQAFLAQVAVESKRLTQPEEELSYTKKVLQATFGKKRFSDKWVEDNLGTDGKANTTVEQAKIANRAYGDRNGNSPEPKEDNKLTDAENNKKILSGEGYEYRGRGLLHLTFKDNYESASKGLKLGNKLVKQPGLVADDSALAARTAAWFFATRKKNGKTALDYANEGDFETVSAIVNGINKETKKPNGYDARLLFWEKSKDVIQLKQDIDYVIIKDFNSSEDIVRLAGSKADYRLSNSASGMVLSYRNDKVAIFQDIAQGLDINGNYFQIG